jgi:malate synthase
MRFPNQLNRILGPDATTASDLLETPTGEITDAGLATNIDVGLQYLAAWLGGNGCVPIYNLMEDAATAEICRAQVWQWLRHGAVSHNQVVETLQRTIDREQGRIPEQQLTLAARLYEEMLDTSHFLDFLTLRAYDYIE